MNDAKLDRDGEVRALLDWNRQLHARGTIADEAARVIHDEESPILVRVVAQAVHLRALDELQRGRAEWTRVASHLLGAHAITYVTRLRAPANTNLVDLAAHRPRITAQRRLAKLAELAPKLHNEFQREALRILVARHGASAKDLAECAGACSSDELAVLGARLLDAVEKFGAEVNSAIAAGGGR